MKIWSNPLPIIMHVMIVELSRETLATFPVCINSSKMEVAPTGWLGTSQFNKPITTQFWKKSAKISLLLTFIHTCNWVWEASNCISLEGVMWEVVFSCSSANCTAPRINICLRSVDAFQSASVFPLWIRHLPFLTWRAWSTALWLYGRMFTDRARNGTRFH